jgi:hypothetical protein
MAASTIVRKAMSPGFFGMMKEIFSPGKMSVMDGVMRFAPDVGFGALSAFQTPGDLGDKAIAFGATAGGGLLGGLGSAGLVRKFGKDKMDPGALQGAMNAADMFGSISGDMIAMPLGDMVARGKDKVMGGKGETAWERMSSGQQEAMRKEMEQSILSQYGGAIPGLGAVPGFGLARTPGIRYDDYLADLGMS